jgi:hypothetical protein
MESVRTELGSEEERIMLRQLIVCAALAIIAGTASAYPPTTEAALPLQSQFQVVVQNAAGRQLYSTYQNRVEARQVAMQLWREGYRVEIWEVRVPRPGTKK